MNLLKLRGKIVENDMSVEKLAQAMNINKSTLYRKFKSGGAELMIKEVYMMVEILKLTPKEANEIFFGQKVA